MSKIVAAALALYSFFLIQTSLPNLPSRIPVHFNVTGQPDGWGSPNMLWVLLGFQVLVCGVMLSMSALGRRYPGSVHFGTRHLSDFTPEQRELVLPLLDQLGGWMSVISSLFFVFIIRESIRATGSANPQFHMGWAAALFIVGMVGVSVYYVRAINRVARAAGS